uniref:Uncharacterized protein n=1 Tax=Cacopsylla melanoneura TaxID=428564 RepID=A0A8D8WJ42_9HEMI
MTQTNFYSDATGFLAKIHGKLEDIFEKMICHRCKFMLKFFPGKNIKVRQKHKMRANFHVVFLNEEYNGAIFSFPGPTVQKSWARVPPGQENPSSPNVVRY